MEHWFLLILAALVVGMSKGGLASAAAIAVPMLALVMNPIQAAAILLPVYIVTDWVGVWIYRRDYSARNLSILVPSMIFGILLATLLTPYASEALLLIATGAIGLWYCARSRLRRGQDAPTRAHVVPGVFWGTLTGIASFITHSGAPPVQAFLLPQRLPKLDFAGTIAIAFAIGNMVKLPGYWALGALDGLDWGFTAALAAAGIVGTVAGRRIVGLLPDAAYVRVIEALLLVLSVLLIGKGLASTLA